jgi:hypothetical protein
VIRVPVKTFWLEPTGRVRIALRRYAHRGGHDGWTCADGWHEAVAWTGEEVDEVRNERGHWVQPVPKPPRDDPRWPVECDKGCGYRFAGEDRWQVWDGALWRRTDTGELRVLHTGMAPPDVPAAEPGACWDATWMGDGFAGPDGIHLMVRCPRPDGSDGNPHDWPADGPASSGGRWTRSGHPPDCDVTVAPSIAIGDPTGPGFYHGWLRDGYLTDHIG